MPYRILPSLFLPLKKSALGFCRLLKDRSLKKWEKHRAEYSLPHETAHEQKKSMISYQVTFLSKIYKNTFLKYDKNYYT